MLASGLLGTFAGHTQARWGWLTIACVAYLVVLHHAGFHAQRAAQGKDGQTRRLFGAMSGSSLGVLALFPMYVPCPRFPVFRPSFSCVLLFGTVDGWRVLAHHEYLI